MTTAAQHTSTATAGTTSETDVVVVGAGPVGLALACALAHHGVRHRVFEQRTEPRTTSRANNLWARPHEHLDGIGVRAALAERSSVITASSVVVDGHALPQAVDEPSSPFGRPLCTGQDVIETTVTDHSARTGTAVDRGRRVLSLTQDDSGVELVVGDARPVEEQDGRGERVRCRYVVGADGDAGTVRGAIGVEVPTEECSDRASRQIDAKLRWARSNDSDQLWFFPYHHGSMGVMPVWGGYHRISFCEDTADVPHREPALEEVQDRLQEISGDPSATLSDPLWASTSGFQHGVADTCAKGRVFLAGDAGHHTIAIGGQGMNAGLHDAVGLAWRLAMTLAGAAGEEVLGSCTAERQRAHAQLDAVQAKGFDRLLYRGRIADAALGVIADELPGVGTRIGGDDLQQMGVAHPDSPISEEHLAARPHGDGPRAGGRAPDARLAAEDGETTTLFASSYDPDGQTWGWCLLGFDGGAGQQAREQLARALGEAATVAWVHPRLVVAAAAAAGEAAGPVPRLFDLDGAAHDGFGLRGTPALVRVRPDGHVAFRAPADRGDLLLQHLARVGAGVGAGEGAR